MVVIMISETPAPPLQPADTPTARQMPFWQRSLLEIIQTVVLAILLYFVIDSVVARVRVENVSMEPTLMPGEFLLVNRLAYRFGEIDYGDIIVFHNPGNPAEDFIKRVIGLPGDMVTVENGIVYINDFPLDESYIAAPPNYSGSWEVPEGGVFVLGDNRNQSSDSHAWGFVPVENIVGRALVIYWPLDSVQILNEPLVVNAAQ
jgi:signal peptidase I